MYKVFFLHVYDLITSASLSSGLCSKECLLTHPPLSLGVYQVHYIAPAPLSSSLCSPLSLGVYQVHYIAPAPLSSGLCSPLSLGVYQVHYIAPAPLSSGLCFPLSLGVYQVHYIAPAPLSSGLCLHYLVLSALYYVFRLILNFKTEDLFFKLYYFIPVYIFIFGTLELFETCVSYCPI